MKAHELIQTSSRVTAAAAAAAQIYHISPADIKPLYFWVWWEAWAICVPAPVVCLGGRRQINPINCHDENEMFRAALRSRGLVLISVIRQMWTLQMQPRWCR